MTQSAAIPAEAAELMHDRSLVEDKPVDVERIASALSNDYSYMGVMSKEVIALDDHITDQLGDQCHCEGELMTIARLSMTDSAQAGYELNKLMSKIIAGYAEQHSDRLAEKYDIA